MSLQCHYERNDLAAIHYVNHENDLVMIVETSLFDPFTIITTHHYNDARNGIRNDHYSFHYEHHYNVITMSLYKYKAHYK